MSSFDNFFNAKNPKKRKENEMKEKKEKMVKNCFMAGLCCLCLLAMTPRAWAGTINNNAAEADAVVGVVNAPSINSSLGVIIDSHAVTNIKNKGNRQISQIGAPVGGATHSYFGDWNVGDYQTGKNDNIFPISLGETWEKTGKTEKIRYKKIWKRIYKKYPATNRITIIGCDKPVKGKKIGSMLVVVNEDQATDDALEIIKSEGMKNGATHVVILAYSAKMMPTSENWSVGFGGGGGGVIGEDEKAMLSGATGTSMGKSSITIETLPFIKVHFFRNGVDGAKVATADAPSQDKTTETISLPKKVEGIK